jgi:GTP1/Obg family GTP-binding protein
MFVFDINHTIIYNSRETEIILKLPVRPLLNYDIIIYTVINKNDILKYSLMT